MSILKFENSEINIKEIDGKPYFRASEICSLLGFSHTSSALRSHCNRDDDNKLKGVRSEHTLTLGGMQEVLFIDEANLYALIFNIPPIKAKDSIEKIEIKNRAKRFKTFVFEEILPSIRKNGYYISKKTFDESLLKYTKRDTQIQNSKDINGLLFSIGGKEAIINYNRENCKMTTGKTTKEIKEIANRLGLKINSAKEICRNIEELRVKSCIMSLNDDLVMQNPVLSNEMAKLKEIDERAESLFLEIEKLIGLDLKKNQIKIYE